MFTYLTYLDYVVHMAFKAYSEASNILITLLHVSLPIFQFSIKSSDSIHMLIIQIDAKNFELHIHHH